MIARAISMAAGHNAGQHTDGPFAETKEQLGGYYLVAAGDADEAISIAANIPWPRYGSIEVRPFMAFS